MRTLAILGTLVALFAGSATAGDYYVNGSTGSDRVEYGGSLQKPWKTVGYALAQIPRDANRHVIHVVGGQVYSPATNGESYPLAMRPRVSVIGVDGASAPVFESGNASGFVLRSDEAFDAAVRYENLAFRRGSAAIVLGGALRDHEPTIANCTFLDIAQDGIRIEPIGFSLTAPKIVGCRFLGGSRGIFALISGSLRSHCFVAPRVVECRFEDLREGILVDHGHDDPQLSAIALEVVACRFVRCTVGIVNSSETLQENDRNHMVVRGSAFSEIGALGISVQCTYGGKIDNLAIEDCTFLTDRPGTTGIQLADCGPMSACLLRRLFLRGLATGLRITGSFLGRGIPRVIFEESEITSCQVGCWLGQSRSSFEFESRRNRYFGNRTAMKIDGDVPSTATIRIDSTILAESTSDGLVIDTSARVIGRGLTIARNGGTGLRVINAASTSSFDHCVASDNSTEVSGTLALTWSVLKGMSYTGVGNLQADPLLALPSYKLTASSPCVDAGSVFASLPAFDYEGDARIVTGPRGAVPDIGADEFVPEGSVHVYGTPGFVAPSYRPRIGSANRTVRVGADLQVSLRGAVAADGRRADAAVLIVGFRDRFRAALGVDSTSILWTDPSAILPPSAVDTLGRSSQTVRIPDAPVWVGLTFATQWIVVAASIPPGLTTTDALRATIGS